MGVRITGVDVGVGVGEGATDGTAGGRILRGSLLTIISFLAGSAFLGVPPRRRGAARMRYRIAEPFKEVANRIACGGGMPAGKKRGYGQDQDDSLKQAIHKCCHFALRSAVFNISRVFLLTRPTTVGRPSYLIPNAIIFGR